MQIDPGTSALCGALIGGAIALFGPWLKAKGDARRAKSQQHLDRVRSTYEAALNGFFNLQRSGNPDRATYGNMFATVSLYGSPAVRQILEAYLTAPLDKKTLDMDALITAMKSHLDALERKNDVSTISQL